MTRSQRFGFERTFVGESLTRREANGLSVLSTKPFASSLNPGHKGKGDSIFIPPSLTEKTCLNPSHKGKGDSWIASERRWHNEVLILVIKERVIPERLWGGAERRILS